MQKIIIRIVSKLELESLINLLLKGYSIKLKLKLYFIGYDGLVTFKSNNYKLIMILLI
jgi:hypothetical protein